LIYQDELSSIFLAKAKLESQLELVRTQEATNGGQASDITKRV
jgi:hypothetical protein